MSETLSLKQLEQKAYRSFFKDGLWDISLGTLLLALGVGGAIARLGIAWGYLIPDLHAITLCLYVVATAVLVVGKKYITVPRMGAVRFGPARKARLSASVLILTGSALLGLVLFLLFSDKLVPAGWLSGRLIGLIAFALNALIVFSLLAYFLDFRRLYGYAVLWALAFPASDTVAAHTPLSGAGAFLLTIGAFSAVMLGIGIVLLARFLRDYPIPAQPQSHRNA
jgi:hypothetical protein